MSVMTQEQIERARLRGYLTPDEALDFLGDGPISARYATAFLKLNDGMRQAILAGTATDRKFATDLS